MGCCGSTIKDNEISKATAQSFFKLEGLPLSLTVVKLDNSRLELRIVGLDCPEELQRLEVALQKRRLCLTSGTLLKVGSHIDQTFELTVKKKIRSPIKDYMTASPSTQVEVEEATAQSICEELPAAKMLMSQVRDAKGLLRLFVKCPMRGGERGLIAETMARRKLRLDCAALMTSDSSTPTMCDTYWMRPLDDDTEDAASTARQICEGFKLALFAHAQSMASLLAAEKKQKNHHLSSPTGQDSASQEHSGKSSDPYSFAAQEHSSTSSYPVARIPSSGSIGGFVNGLNQKVVNEDLPLPLRWTQNKLEYNIRPSSAGFVVDGYQKYVGMGLVHRSMKEMLSGKKDPDQSLVLEMRTFFISQKQASAAGHLAQFSHMVHEAVVGTPEHSHFVTWMNVTERTWTIDRVFLNDVLPAGNGYGGKAISEHLLAPPDLLFPDSKSQLLGSFIDSLPDLQKIVVCDVVNWNTYMLMAVAGSTTKQATDKLGDVLGFALQSELQAADLTRAQLSEWSLLDVFQRTVLGKMCSSVIKRVNNELKHNLKMESAEVIFGEGDEEMFGQRRPRMAIIVNLASNDLEAARRSKVRLASASEKLVPAQVSLHFGRQHSNGPETAHWWGGLPPMDDGESTLDKTQTPTSRRASQSMTLEGMGEFLEESWAEGYVQELTTHAHAESSSCFYFASMASGMTRLMHEMQIERGLSCRACAASADEAMKDSGTTKASERLQQQRGKTDKSLRQLIELVKIASSLAELGKLEARHQDVLRLQEQISIGLIVQRRLVDDAISDKINNWMDRYLMVCSSGDSAYHVLVGKLLHGIVRALHFALEEVKQAEPREAVAERCAILLRCKEQVGQERALIAAKGNSRWVESALAQDAFDTIKKGSLRLAHLVRSEGLHWSAPDNKLIVVSTLQEMHDLYEKEGTDPSYSIPASKAIAWFELLTRWIDAAYDQIQAEIEAITEQLPEDNVAKPCADMALMDPPEPLSLDARDEQAGLIVSELKAGKFSNVVVMAGAGISVSANLPDFRSKGGLYDQLRHTTNITSPETIFTSGFLNKNPELFNQVMQKLRVDGVEPTLTHAFLKLLEKKKILKRLYTQNIDSLERKVGIQEANLIECHGTTARSKCQECRKVYSKEDYFDWKGEGVPRCHCGGLLRPDIVLFGEPLPTSFQTSSTPDFQEADLLIIMGTSLQVHPFASLPKLVKSNCAILVVNRELPRSLSLHRQVRSLQSRLTGKKLRKEVFLQGDCDTSIRWLASELGWSKQLEEIRQPGREIIST